LNNPLVYTDPDGEFIFTIAAAIFCPPLLPVAIGTDIGWMTGGMRSSFQGETFWHGAWRGGLVGAVGGGLSMIGGVGMSFAENLALGTAEGALTGGLDAALWGNDIGEGMLWGAAGGAVFTTLTSENFSNWTKGKGFYTNENVFENFRAGKYSIPKGSNWQNASLDYFGFEGEYKPSHPLLTGTGDPGVTDPKTGDIFYNKKAFSSYYNLKFTADHELKHRLNVLAGKYKNTKLTNKVRNMEEFSTYQYNYKRQGLYPNHTFDIEMRLNAYGTGAGIYPLVIDKYFLDKPWWHFIYKIPRRW
jgi:hypothetical protein